jgi:UDP-glucose 4-epimerase
MVDLLVGRGFAVRVIDNLLSGRESNLAQHAGNADVTLRIADIRQLLPGDPMFDGVRYVFHFAGIGDIVPSVERPLEYMSANVLGTV